MRVKTTCSRARRFELAHLGRRGWTAVLLAIGLVSPLWAQGEKHGEDGWQLLAELIAPNKDPAAARPGALSRLRGAMERAGLREIEVFASQSQGGEIPGDPELLSLQGLLPGAAEGEILLLAHCLTDATDLNPVLASDCAVALAALLDLSRTPLEHSVRVLLLGGRRQGRLASRTWLQGLDSPHRRRILAALEIDQVGRNAEKGGVIHLLAGDIGRAGAAPRTPGWLIHALRESAKAIDWPMSVADRRFSVLGQLVARSTVMHYDVHSSSFLERGIPAATVSDTSLLSARPVDPPVGAQLSDFNQQHLRSWTDLVAASVRRLDSLGGRPRPDDEYLVFAGRLWIRRDLLWAGFLLWLLLVFRARPGRWRGASDEDRRDRGRLYVPGFIFRGLFLVTTLAAPAHAALLIFPLAPLAIITPRVRGLVILWQGLGCSPTLVWACAMAVAAWGGAAGGYTLGLTPTALLTATLLTYAWHLQVEAKREQVRTEGQP